MTQAFSKENQSSAEAAYRFGEFELHPTERLLKESGGSISLQPKAFDALLCLVRRAGRLVSKRELTETLWPSVHVSEANLTNIVVNLRRVVGRDSIGTVSKHGYRFELPVLGEPGVPQATYARFVRARELTVQRSLDSMVQARDLYWNCIAEDPNFAPAWAWLGRCCWFFEKFTDRQVANSDLTHSVFRRAFALDPDLAAAHQFYTLVQVDSGEAQQAMARLLLRLKSHPDEPESLTGLVQVFRFRGLLKRSMEMHRLAAEVDPAIVTSVAHTYFLACEYGDAIQAYSGRAAYYLDAASWAALGDLERAATLLRARLSKASLSRLMTALMTSLLAVLEGRVDDAVRFMESADARKDPEILMYFGRHYSRLGLADSAIDVIRRAAREGFVCATDTLLSDPWLQAVREHSEFSSLLLELQAETSASEGVL